MQDNNSLNSNESILDESQIDDPIIYHNDNNQKSNQNESDNEDYVEEYNAKKYTLKKKYLIRTVIKQKMCKKAG
jgi:hypothetical protein